jgi:uncharacterized protein involved in response to NO
MATLHLIEEPPVAGPDRFALWELGFRPFYLLAAGMAALSVPLWALQFSGLLARPVLAGPVWHAHEMLFGFALAVIVGFLFTAGRNWTGQPTPTGVPLMALAALWLAARVLVLTPFTLAAALANVAFPWAAAVALAVPLVRARNRRNYFFVGVLALLGVAAAVVHAAEAGLVARPSRAGLQLGLDLVLFVASVMAGRVVPMFTNNGVPGASAARMPAVERTALGAVLLLLAADAAALPGPVVAVVAAAGALAHGVRWWRWQPWRTRRVPLVWVLHLAYLWVPVHLLLRVLGEAGLVAPTLATHALTTGAIGALVIGMMTRTARGHTARPLRADRVDVASYVLVLGGAVVRVAVPLVAPALWVEATLVSALLWSGGFALYLLHYGPWLVRARLDGRPG